MARWALITGASAGLGVEFARQLTAKGYDVVLVARRKDRLQELARDFEKQGRSTMVIEADLASSEGVAGVLRGLEERDVVPDLLVNNAGVGYHGAALEQGADKADAMLRVNVLALTELALTLGRRMAARGAGAILNVSSTSCFQPNPWFAAYGASKAYVTSFSLALAQELAPRGVHVLAHCPGPTRTGVQRTRWRPRGARQPMALHVGAGVRGHRASRARAAPSLGGDRFSQSAGGVLGGA